MNGPMVIYLQGIAPEPTSVDLSLRRAYDQDVTWCRHKIHKDDTTYLRLDKATPMIEAAQEMLDALRQFVKWHDEFTTPAELQEAVIKARTAIAKVEAESLAAQPL